MSVRVTGKTNLTRQAVEIESALETAMEPIFTKGTDDGMTWQDMFSLMMYAADVNVLRHIRKTRPITKTTESDETLRIVDHRQTIRDVINQVISSALEDGFTYEDIVYWAASEAWDACDIDIIQKSRERKRSK